MTPETVLAKCAECAEIQQVPAIARCDACGSRQLRRLDPTEEGLRDLLADLDNMALLLTDSTARIDKARAVVAKLLDRIVAS